MPQRGKKSRSPSPVPHHSSPVTHYFSSPITHYLYFPHPSPLTTHYSLLTHHPSPITFLHPSPITCIFPTPHPLPLTTHHSLLTHHPLPITCILFIGSKQLTPSPGAIMRPYQFTRLFHAFTSPQSPARFPISPFLPRLNESTTQRLHNLLNASTIHPSPLTIYHSLLTTHFLLITHYPLLFARHPSPITHHKK